MLTRFNLTKLSVLEDTIKYDSFDDQSETKIKCPLFFVKNSTTNLQNSTRTGSFLRNTTSVLTKSFLEKTKKMFYENKLTIILVCVCVIFCVFCLVMIKLVFLKSRSKIFIVFILNQIKKNTTDVWLLFLEIWPSSIICQSIINTML